MIDSENVIWLSGLSGSGKTTLSTHLASELTRCGYRAYVLDGDELRLGLCADLGFSQAERRENVRRAAQVARTLSKAGHLVIVALITPLEAMREMVKGIIPELTHVFVDAPLPVCEARDPKGFYKQAREGKLAEFTGVSSKFERPSHPDVVCQTDVHKVEICVSQIMTYLMGRGKVINEGLQLRPRSIAVDFDGVISNYDGWKGEGVHGAPRQDVLTAMRQLRVEGWKLLIHTTRSADDIMEFLKEHEVPFDEINGNSAYSNKGMKPVATVYWDDRAVCYSGDAAKDLHLIRAFRTWANRP